MADSHKLTATRIGLRAYDTTIGFRNIEERSSIVSEFSPTHTIGMAAVLAGAIKGKDVIKDARKLKQIAADVLKINAWAFDKVVYELSEMGMVRGIERNGVEITSFYENIPLFYNNMHETLGLRWNDLRPSELEAQFLTAIDKLSYSPVTDQQLFDDIGADQRAIQKLQAVGEKAALVRYYSLSDGRKIAVSPLHAFENPDKLTSLFENHYSEKVQQAFKKIRTMPGFPILMDNTQPVIEDMVRLGLVPAPTVLGADNQERAFVIMLYGLDPIYLTVKKQILDRALALIACVRCGEVSGGITHIKMPDRLLAALIDPSRNYTLRGHSSTPRQYAPLVRLGVITLVKSAFDRWSVRLIPTQDNIEVVQLARTLLQRKGDGVPERGNEQEAAKLLFTGGEYLAPLETIAVTANRLPRMSDAEIIDTWGQALLGEL